MEFVREISYRLVQNKFLHTLGVKTYQSALNHFLKTFFSFKEVSRIFLRGSYKDIKPVLSDLDFAVILSSFPNFEVLYSFRKKYLKLKKTFPMLGELLILDEELLHKNIKNHSGLLMYLSQAKVFEREKNYELSSFSVKPEYQFMVLLDKFESLIRLLHRGLYSQNQYLKKMYERQLYKLSLLTSSKDKTLSSIQKKISNFELINVASHISVPKESWLKNIFQVDFFNIKETSLPWVFVYHGDELSYDTIYRQWLIEWPIQITPLLLFPKTYALQEQGYLGWQKYPFSYNLLTLTHRLYTHLPLILGDFVTAKDKKMKFDLKVLTKAFSLISKEVR